MWSYSWLENNAKPFLLLTFADADTEYTFRSAAWALCVSKPEF